MCDSNGIRVRIVRGAVQIGGVCTEIFTNRARIFFDFGSPLEGEGNQDKLSIEGLTYGTVNTDAVFLTHYHGDHVGEVPDIMPGIPVYMHKTARRILQAQQEHKKCLGQVVWANRISELTAGEPVTIKDLKITPLASDHSACDSLMYLIEGHDKRILITGDYRLHGFYGDRVMKTYIFILNRFLRNFYKFCYAKNIKNYPILTILFNCFYPCVKTYLPSSESK